MDIVDIRPNFYDCGLLLDEEKTLLFQIYLKLLRQENEKYNLTRIDDVQAIVEEHFYDSLAGVINGMKTNVMLLDLGCGPGFPGVPLKIFLPDLKLFLLEATRKKTIFLGKVIRELKLKDVTLWQQRAEILARGPARESFPWVTARAVAPLAVILELALPFVQLEGNFWAWHGPKASAEMKRSEAILSYGGGKLVDIFKYKLPISRKERVILNFKKVAPTDPRFPRKSGIPQKRPWLSK